VLRLQLLLLDLLLQRLLVRVQQGATLVMPLLVPPRPGQQTHPHSHQLALALLLLLLLLVQLILMLLRFGHHLVPCLQQAAVMLGPASLKLLQQWIQLGLQLHLHAQGMRPPKLLHHSACLTAAVIG
jgi:hypothetical protein